MTPAHLSQQLQCRFDVLVQRDQREPIQHPDGAYGFYPRAGVDAGECCAWIDARGTFDAESAAEAGLNLEQLLWVNGLRPFIPLIDATSPSSVTYLREL